jgi:hypothetical protein
VNTLPPPTPSPARATSAPVLRAARLVLRVDALFEGLLGLALLTSPLTGLYGALQLPAPAFEPVVIVVGILLLPLLPLLWWWAHSPRRPILRLLAAANGVTTLIFALWVLICHNAFTAAGALFVLIVAGLLAALATLGARLAVIVR